MDITPRKQTKILSIHKQNEYLAETKIIDCEHDVRVCQSTLKQFTGHLSFS